MSHFIITFTLFLVSATTIAGSFGVSATSPRDVAVAPSRWRPLASDANFTECDGMPAGQVVCADDCTKVVLCMGGSIPPTLLETCEEENVCSAEQRKCTNGTSTCPQSTSAIKCNAAGVFPDPYVCTAYHICVNGSGSQSTRVNCDSGWAYDPLTATCRLKVADSVCSDLPLKCSNIGDNNAVPANPSIYYVCISENQALIPDLHKCDHGDTYDPTSLGCVSSSKTCGCYDSAATSPTPSGSTTTSPSSEETPSPDDPTPSATPSSPSGTPTPTPSNTPSTTTPPSEGKACYTPNERVADPEDCYSYYLCTIVYTWTHRECDTGSYFDEDTLECKYGTCSNDDKF